MRDAFSAAVVAIFTFGLLSIPATAVADTEDLRQKYALPTHVQLKPFQVPTTRAGRMTAITVFLEAYDREKTGAICRYSPRIMDAIMSRFYRNPLPLNGRSVDLSGVAASLVDPINRSLGGKWVKSVHIEKGAKRMTSGSVSRLPFNASGCKGLKEMEK